MRAARATMREAAELIGAEAELAALSPFLFELAPEDAPALRADPAGAFWIGAAFAPGAAPRLRVYVNGSWGSRPAQSARLRRFAAHFDRAEAWDRGRGAIPPALAPLGLALTLAPGGKVRGAIYLRAFGLRLSDYAALASVASGQANAERIRAFGAALLGADAAHPTAERRPLLRLRPGARPARRARILRPLPLRRRRRGASGTGAPLRLRPPRPRALPHPRPRPCSACTPPGPAAPPFLHRRRCQIRGPRLHRLHETRPLRPPMTLGPEISAALSRGLDFVLAAQDAEGAWTDWALPPGPSPDWTTAYVGLRLSVPRPAPPRGARRPARPRRALAPVPPGRSGGWGYNRALGELEHRALLFQGQGERRRHRRPEGCLAPPSSPPGTPPPCRRRDRRGA